MRGPGGQSRLGYPFGVAGEWSLTVESFLFRRNTDARGNGQKWPRRKRIRRWDLPVKALITGIPGLRIGAERTISCRVGKRHMVRRMFPGVPEFVRKPDVMATGWLVGVCEWPAMEELREHMTDTQCSLGTGIAMSHLAPIPPGATLRVTARCLRIDGAFSEWAVHARDDREMVATGTVGFVVVDFGRFVSRRLAPKAAELATTSRKRTPPTNLSARSLRGLFMLLARGRASGSPGWQDQAASSPEGDRK